MPNSISQIYTSNIIKNCHPDSAGFSITLPSFFRLSKLAEHRNLPKAGNKKDPGHSAA